MPGMNCWISSNQELLDFQQNASAGFTTALARLQINKTASQAMYATAFDQSEGT
jgi:hypothetical protein